jgi:methionyl-tRNA formyltransferase
MKTCVLLLRDGHFFNTSAEVFVRSRLQVLAVAETRSVDEAALAALKPDLVISFFCEKILTGGLLEVPGVNFHPAPPAYAGRGGASLALFDGATEYGATAHIIERAVDGGAILDVRRFAITSNDNCETVYLRAELAAMDQLIWVVDHIVENSALPPATTERWLRPPMTRRQFEAWLMLDPADPDAFERKVRAARHSRFAGPFLMQGGHRFALSPPSATPSKVKKGV